MTTNSDGVAVYCEDVSITVIEAVPLNKVEMHREKAIFALESYSTRDTRVFASLLAPVIEDVTRCQNCHRRYYCFYHVRTIEACLIVSRTI